jgi:hypothetical protein
MPAEKFYCGNCGSPLYYGRKFQEHALLRPCPDCHTLNSLSFHYCYRCGIKILASEESADEEAL